MGRPLMFGEAGKSPRESRKGRFMRVFPGLASRALRLISQRRWSGDEPAEGPDVGQFDDRRFAVGPLREISRILVT
jgi:hypothetical protein